MPVLNLQERFQNYNSEIDFVNSNKFSALHGFAQIYLRNFKRKIRAISCAKFKLKRSITFFLKQIFQSRNIYKLISLYNNTVVFVLNFYFTANRTYDFVMNQKT